MDSFSEWNPLQEAFDKLDLGIVIAWHFLRQVELRNKRKDHFSW